MIPEFVRTLKAFTKMLNNQGFGLFIADSTYYVRFNQKKYEYELFKNRKLMLSSKLFDVIIERLNKVSEHWMLHLTSKGILCARKVNYWQAGGDK